MTAPTPDPTAGQGLSEVERVALRWEEVLAECQKADPRWILDRSVTTLDACLAELRAALKTDAARESAAATRARAEALAPFIAGGA